MPRETGRTVDALIFAGNRPFSIKAKAKKRSAGRSLH